jgi:hypothetical protein
MPSGVPIWVGTKIRRGELLAQAKKILEPKWSPWTPSREVNRTQEYTREQQHGEETGAEKYGRLPSQRETIARRQPAGKISE